MIENTLKTIYFWLGGHSHHKLQWSGMIAEGWLVLSLSMTVFGGRTHQRRLQSGAISSINLSFLRQWLMPPHTNACFDMLLKDNTDQLKRTPSNWHKWIQNHFSMWQSHAKFPRSHHQSCPFLKICLNQRKWEPMSDIKTIVFAYTYLIWDHPLPYFSVQPVIAILMFENKWF